MTDKVLVLRIEETVYFLYYFTIPASMQKHVIKCYSTTHGLKIKLFLQGLSCFPHSCQVSLLLWKCLPHLGSQNRHSLGVLCTSSLTAFWGQLASSLDWPAGCLLGTWA